MVIKLNYLCISDYEGTLINTNRTISNLTIEYINNFVKNNSFIIVSEASFKELNEFVNKYKLNVDYFSISEAIFKINNKVFYIYLKNEKLSKLIEKFDDYIYTAYSNDNVYKYQERLFNLYPNDYKISADFIYSTFLNISIDIKIDSEFIDYLNENNLYYTLIGKDKNRAFYNIKSAKITKESAYDIIIDYYKNKKTIGIADSYSDLGLLNKCDIKLAMKNSDNKLKECINNITKYSNNEDGLYYALNDICHLQ